MNNHQLLAPEDCNRLCAAASAATAKAFLTKEGGTRYGAAVLSRSGAIFSSGQYSSFNHVTNVHAEQAALLIAAMAGEPDILVLAVASNAEAEVTRPCGVCRQVMLEHSQRTGRDFLVLMVNRTGGYEELKVSELLPCSWAAQGTPASRPSALRPGAGIYTPRALSSTNLQTADLVSLKNGAIALVWDPNLLPGKSLAKIKYAPPQEGFRRKLAHSFTESIRYESELIESGWARPTGFGPLACLLSAEDMTGIYPSRLQSDSLPALAPVLDVTSAAGIPPDRITVTGSRALGIATPDSDFDLLIQASPEEIEALRHSVLSLVSLGKATIPELSGTWKLLSQAFPGGATSILSQYRFAETFALGSLRVAVILTPTVTQPPVLTGKFQFLGHKAIHGKVIAAAYAPYKRATFLLRESDGREVSVYSYHKLANLVREGDKLALRGWEVETGGRHCLIQLALHRDNVVWLT